MPELLEPPVAPVAAKPAAVAAATSDPEQTREFLRRISERQERMMGRTKPKEPAEAVTVEPPAKKKKAAPAVAEETPKEEVKIESKPEPELEKPPVAVAPTPQVDSKLIADSVGRAVKEALNTRAQPEPKAVPQPDALPQEEQEKQADLVVLEKMFPRQYKDITADRVKFLDRQRKHEEKWIADHPGEDFDPDASEHDEFFAQDPLNKVDARHLAKAIAEQMMQAERVRTEARLQEVATHSRVQPQAEKDSASLAVSVAADVGGDDFKAIVNADGSINEQQRQQMMQTDPIRARVTSDAAFTAKTVIGEAVKIFNNAATFNPAANEAHGLLAAYWKDAEKELLGAGNDWFQKNDPQKRSLDDFMPFDVFYAKDTTAKERAGKWSLGEAELKRWVAHRVVQDAKESISNQESELQRTAERLGYTKPAAKKAADADAAKVAVEADEDEEKPHSPSSSVEPKMVGVKGAPQTDVEKAMQARMNRFMGR